MSGLLYIGQYFIDEHKSITKDDNYFTMTTNTPTYFGSKLRFTEMIDH